jgi:hypothetical protein
MILSKEEATEFFSIFYRGEHHFPGELKKFGEGWAMSYLGGLSTFDLNDLTRLVFLAHDKCIRVDVSQGGPNRLRLAVWKRKREGSLYERHPTIEQALEKWRAEG